MKMQPFNPIQSYIDGLKLAVEWGKHCYNRDRAEFMPEELKHKEGIYDNK